MTSGKRRPAVPGSSSAALNREVHREIATFLQAVNSYPESFARDPLLSFHQHLFTIAAENSSAGNFRRG
jgi:hypothetical protein